MPTSKRYYGGGSSWLSSCCFLSSVTVRVAHRDVTVCSRASLLMRVRVRTGGVPFHSALQAIRCGERRRRRQQHLATATASVRSPGPRFQVAFRRQQKLGRAAGPRTRHSRWAWDSPMCRVSAHSGRRGFKFGAAIRCLACESTARADRGEPPLLGDWCNLNAPSRLRRRRVAVCHPVAPGSTRLSAATWLCPGQG